MKKNIDFGTKDIEVIFFTYPCKIQEKLLNIRELIFSLEIDIDGKIKETIKWGEPSYVVNKGSTVRINKVRGENNNFGVYFNCKTTLISTFKEIFGSRFKYDGNRGLIFNVNDEIDLEDLRHCIYLSFIYFENKHK